MYYQVFQAPPDVDGLDADMESWVSETGTDEQAAFTFDFETEPLFGSPTEYNGLIIFGDDLVTVGAEAGGSATAKVAQRLSDTVDSNIAPLSLDLEAQYALVEETNGYVRKIVHPRYEEHEVAAIARTQSLDESEAVDMDDVRAEARSEKYPIVSAHLRKDGVTVNCTPSPLSVADLPGTVESALWVTNTVRSVLD